MSYCQTEMACYTRATITEPKPEHQTVLPGLFPSRLGLDSAGIGVGRPEGVVAWLWQRCAFVNRRQLFPLRQLPLQADSHAWSSNRFARGKHLRQIAHGIGVSENY